MTTNVPGPALYADNEGNVVVRRDLPVPTPAEGEILIEVLFSGSNPSDLRIVNYLGFRNFVLGYDFCGRVLETPGPNGSGLKVGDIVAGYTSYEDDQPIRWGTHQSYISRPPIGIFKVPANLPLPDAAALTTVVQTANDALFHLFKLPLPSSGHGHIEGTLVVWGGGTAVGMSAIQLARAVGITSIIVTASASRHGVLRELGATQCFDYHDESVIEQVKRAVQEAGNTQVWGFDTAGTPDSSRLLMDSLASCQGDVQFAFVGLIVGDRPASEMCLAVRHHKLAFDMPGAPEPYVFPAKPAEAEKMWQATEWVVAHYGKEFRLPGLRVFEGRAEEALDHLQTVARQGTFGTPPPWKIIGTGTHVQPEVMSPETWDMIRGWVGDCINDHEDCKVVSEDRPFPTRVVAVGGEDTEPHLFIPSSDDRGRYIALNFARFPKTFQDAIIVCRKLNIKYLWIESLCIIQDDEHDWAVESPKMCDVYQNAYLTIAAAAAHNSSEGLFHPRPFSVQKMFPTASRNDDKVEEVEIFARPWTLETDYSESDQDSSGQVSAHVELVYYELDLGLNRVVRKWSETVDPTASLLSQVLGGDDGPGSVLVFAEESITYHHLNQDPLRVPIPRRRGATEDLPRKRTIIGGVMHKLKNTADAFFFLLQTEDGDLLKLTFDMHDSEGSLAGEVRRIKIKYFDTVPVASSLCILKTGFLFVAAEFGNHHFYQIEKLGEDDDAEPVITSDDFSTGPRGAYQPVYFDPRPLKNLALLESIDSLSPLLDCEVADPTGEGPPQIYSESGNGARSHFWMLKHGLEINKVASSDLPGTVSGVWTTRMTRHDKFDSYIILTSSDGTVVMSVGDEVEQVSDSGFLTTVTTLAIQQIGDDGIVQIHSKGIRHLRAGQINEWPAPQHRSIVAVTTNKRQIAIALSSGEIVYFEVDSDGSLAEYDETKVISTTVTCLSLGPVPEGRLRSPLLVVGCEDCTVRILGLNPDSMLESNSIKTLTAVPSALIIMAMEHPLTSSSGLCLHIGLSSGVYLRTGMNEITGELSDTQTRFLGLKAIKLFQVTVKGQTCVLALGSKPWMGYIDPKRGFTMTPLECEELHWASSFSSEQCQEGIIAIHANFLHIFSVENLHNNVVRKSIPLTYTPRHFVKHPAEPYFYTIEVDNNTLSPELRAQLLAVDDHGDDKVLPPELFGYPRGNGRWASCISIIDPIGEQVLQRIDLEGNEAAISIAVAPFTSQDGEIFLLVGTGKDMILNPRQSSGGYIHVYRFHQNGRELQFIHKTKVEEPPMALVAFRDRLAVGLGKDLCIYDLGLKQLLRKAHIEAAPQLIVSLDTQGDRIVVGDVQQGMTMVMFNHEEQRLIPFVDDIIARWTTCTTMVDYESVVGGDKFVAHFFAHDIPTSIAKANLIVGGQDVLVWSGLQGTIGVLIPFVTHEDAEFFHTLEMQMRTLDSSPVGRDHLMYRSYYEPIKGFIDGDLCERYRLLPADKKQQIADKLDRSVRDIERKVSDVRTRSAF
ncbi:Pre-mRNA-splicing factor rse1 [Fusarium oxysporum f. sp. conglutinans]|nr:Pre-mRNA-splicing factor rse1 [Fusarium oxysporum f. sp. conglutinans]